MPENAEETGLLVILLTVAGYMVYESFAYGETAGRFPRLTGGVVLVGAVLLLVREYLPDRVEAVVGESAELFDSSADAETDRAKLLDADDEDETEAESGAAAERRVSDSVFTTASIIGYTVSSYYVGMLWMSPLFVLLYSRWYRHPWWATGVLTVIAAGLAYGFMELLNLPLDEGALLQSVIVVPSEVVLWPL